MPVKNKKVKTSAKKNVKRKPTSKSSRPVAKKPMAKKIVKPSKTVRAKTAKAALKKKPLSKAKAPLRKSPTKKKRVSAPASKAIKKKTTKKVKITSTQKINNKKSNTPQVKARATTSKTTSTVATKAIKKMVKKVEKQVKPTIPTVKTTSPAKAVSLVKAVSPVKKTTTFVKHSVVPTNTQKPVVEKPRVAEIVRLVKAVAKKAHAAQAATQRVKRPGAGPSGFLPYEAERDEDYMNEAQLAHFQRVLHLWKEQLYAGRDATTQHMRDDTINFPDPLDRAALEEEHTLEWRAREREHRLITKIDQALARIKQGDYGYCDACGAEIGVRRLEARPTATQCIDCKTIDEIRERHTGTVE